MKRYAFCHCWQSWVLFSLLSGVDVNHSFTRAPHGPQFMLLSHLIFWLNECRCLLQNYGLVWALLCLLGQISLMKCVPKCSAGPSSSLIALYPYDFTTFLPSCGLSTWRPMRLITYTCSTVFHLLSTSRVFHSVPFLLALVLWLHYLCRLV